MDAHDLYELTVQSPAELMAFLRSIHGHAPRVLREDFSGTAALSRVWVAGVERGSAFAVDHDPLVLARTAGVPGLTRICGDVRSVIVPAGTAPDVIFAGNFSIGELHTRADLMAYLRGVRARLATSGIFACDTYGGASAFRIGAVERTHVAPDGALIRYIWEQREADPTTARVVNALHFRVVRGGEVVHEITDAFVYSWRLWSVPELRDALMEAGFRATEVYAELRATGARAPMPVRAARVLGDSFIVCIVGRV